VNASKEIAAQFLAGDSRPYLGNINKLNGVC
jgi:hypothetical protein